MRLRCSAYLALSICVTSVTAFAGPSSPAASAASPQEQSADTLSAEQRVLEDFFTQLHEFTLPNGLTVLMHRRGTAPVFAGAVSVRVGGVNEPAGSSGISHLLEHMAFKGTSAIGTTDFSRERRLLDELETIAGASNGGTELSTEQRSRWEALTAELRKIWQTEAFTRSYEVVGSVGLNATTSAELTQYFVNLPRDSFEFFLRMERDRLLDPVMRQFYEERGVVLEERRRNWEDNPSGKLYVQLLATAFQHHPYRNPTIGYKEEVSVLRAAQLDEFRKRFYVPSNIVLTLVGDVDPVRDRPLIERYFGALPSGPKPVMPSVVEPPQEGERRVTVEAPAQRQLWVAYRFPTYPHPDDAPLSVLLEILAGSPISPLYMDLVRAKKVATAVDYSEEPGLAFPNLGIFFITSRAPHSNEDVLTEFDRALSAFIERGPTDKQLRMAKRRVTVSFLEQLDENSTLARNLASAKLLYGDSHAVLKWYREAMAVTLQDVQRVAQSYLVPRTRTVALLESQKSKP